MGFHCKWRSVMCSEAENGEITLFSIQNTNVEIKRDRGRNGSVTQRGREGRALEKNLQTAVIHFQFMGEYCKLYYDEDNNLFD